VKVNVPEPTPDSIVFHPGSYQIMVQLSTKPMYLLLDGHGNDGAKAVMFF
jgi:hypothetical protein